MSDVIRGFWNAPEDALFDEGCIAAVMGKSRAWAQKARWTGSGPNYLKLGRNVRYRKRDVLAWMNARSAVSEANV